MFVADRLVYLDLHKTGGTSIAHNLSACVGGKQVGKHNRAPKRLLSRFILGSIRNPWEWYVSLWAFGCAGKGTLFHRLTTPPRSTRWLLQQLLRATAHGGKGLGQALGQFRESRKRPEAHRTRWLATYEAPHDRLAFKKWLSMVLDPVASADIREGFANSSVGKIAGFLTFRYLWLYSRDVSPVLERERFHSVEELVKFDSGNNLLDYVIRQENLENDLIHAIELAGYEISDEQKGEILQRAENKLNTSRHLAAESYYDEEAAEWVSARERFIIEKYGYEFPSATQA